MANFINTVADVTPSAAAQRDLSGCKQLAIGTAFVQPANTVDRPLVTGDLIDPDLIIEDGLQYSSRTKGVTEVDTAGGSTLKIADNAETLGDIVFQTILPPTSAELQLMELSVESQILYKFNMFRLDKTAQDGVGRITSFVPLNDATHSYAVTLSVTEYTTRWAQ